MGVIRNSRVRVVVRRYAFIGYEDVAESWLQREWPIADMWRAHGMDEWYGIRMQRRAV